MHSSTVTRRLVAPLTGALIASTLALAWAAPVSAEVQYFAELSGDQEVPGPGDEEAYAFARLTVDSGDGRICVTYFLSELEPVTAAHIHEGAAGTAGAVVVDMPVPENDEGDGGCVNELDPDLLEAIATAPGNYYLNLHTESFPDGAIRGQLEAFDLTRVSVAKFVCPASIQSVEDLLAAPDGTCTPAARTGTFDDPPDGYTYDPPVLAFDMQVSIADEIDVRGMDDADIDGGGTCDPVAMTCNLFRTYRWDDVAVGEVGVTETTFPNGYHFGWATVESMTDGHDAPEAFVSGRTVYFDPTGVDVGDGVFVRIYDFVGEGPGYTPPQTSSATPRVPTAPAMDVLVLAMLGALAAAIAAAAVGRRARSA